MKRRCLSDGTVSFLLKSFVDAENFIGPRTKRTTPARFHVFLSGSAAYADRISRRSQQQDTTPSELPASSTGPVFIMKERTARTSSSTALLGLAALAVIPSCQAFAPWGFSPVQQLQSASNTKSVAACASTRRSSITSCNYYRFSSALSHVHDPRIAAVDVRRRLRGLQVLGATSAPSVEVDGDGSAVDVEDSPVVVGEEQEEVKPKTVKPRKKRAPVRARAPTPIQRTCSHSDTGCPMCV